MGAGSIASKLGTYSPANPSGVDGLLKTIYVTRRGTSPRVITAYVVGDAGIHAISGASLRANLGLRDTWVFFRSMSITPSQGTHKVIAFGSSSTLTGRTYPALPSGATVTLHYYRSGAWRTQTVTTTRGGIALPDGLPPVTRPTRMPSNRSAQAATTSATAATGRGRPRRPSR